MSGHYGYYDELCKCNETSRSSAGEAGAMYDDISAYCICPGGTVYLGMRDLDGEEVSSFPVTVYNINGVEIGLATTKGEYIAVWNSDPDNQAVGHLMGGVGPFGFALVMNAGQTAPPWVIGEPAEDIDTRIYAEEYAGQYE